MNSSCLLMRRRQVIAIGAAAVTATGGCVGDRSDDREVRYQNLAAVTVYVGSSIDGSLPKYVAKTSTPTEATVAFLGGQPDVTKTDLYSWIEAGTAVSIIGRPAVERASRLLPVDRLGDTYKPLTLQSSEEMDYVVVRPAGSKLRTSSGVYQNDPPSFATLANDAVQDFPEVKSSGD